jgi:catechol 2,3-dioxygenase-like lactoylglutathione lyase family enzyme
VSGIRFGLVTPTFGVPDLAGAIRYYTQCLGFVLDFEWGAPPTFAGLYRDSAQLFLSARGDVPFGGRVTIEVDDVDELQVELLARGAEVVFAPIDEPYGVRDMAVRDSAGNLLFFSSETPVNI